MPTPDIATQATWSINSTSQGNKKIRRMKTAGVTSNASVDAVTEMGSSVPVGFEVKPGAFMVSLNIKETKGIRPEVDWYKLDETKETFALTRQVLGGRRMQYPICMVSKVDEEGDADGKHEYTVEIVALERKRL